MRRWQAAMVAIIAALALGAVSFGSSSPAHAGIATINLRLDCDTGTAGIQTACIFGSGTATAAVDVVLENNTGADFQIAAFDFVVLGSPIATFAPATPSCLPPGVDCNPDLIVSGSAWSCSGPTPSPDINADGDPSTAQSFITCINNSDGPTVIDGGAGVVLGRVNYNVSGDGLGSFDVTNGSVFDINGLEAGNCGDGTAACFGATIQIGSSGATPTFTAVPTDTNTPVPTATPCSGSACPTRTSLAFITITPTPSATVPPSATPPATGSTPPPGGSPSTGTGGGGAGGGTGPIRLPDTGMGADAADQSLVLALGSIGLAALLGGALVFNLAAAGARVRREGK